MRIYVSDVSRELGIPEEYLKDLKARGAVKYSPNPPTYGVEIDLKEFLKLGCFYYLKDFFTTAAIEKFIELAEKTREFKKNRGG